MQNTLHKLYQSGINMPIIALRTIWAILMIFIFSIFLGVQYPMVFPYWGHKMLHIMAISILIGSILHQMISDTWCMSSQTRTMYFSVHKYALWLSVLYYLTAFIIIYNGLVMAVQWGGVYDQNWLFLPVLFNFLTYLTYHPIMDTNFVNIIKILDINNPSKIHDILTIQEQHFIRTQLIIQWAYTIITGFGLGFVFYCMLAKPELSWATPIKTACEHFLKIF